MVKNEKPTRKTNKATVPEKEEKEAEIHTCPLCLSVDTKQILPEVFLEGLLLRECNTCKERFYQ